MLRNTLDRAKLLSVLVPFTLVPGDPALVGLLGAVVQLTTFIVILWNLSRNTPLIIGGTHYNIPGYLVWAALAYAILGTFVTHRIGKKLVRLNFEQQRYEADFRFGLVRLREHSEEVALLHGEDRKIVESPVDRRDGSRGRVAAVTPGYYQGGYYQGGYQNTGGNFFSRPFGGGFGDAQPAPHRRAAQGRQSSDFQ